MVVPGAALRLQFPCEAQGVHKAGMSGRAQSRFCQKRQKVHPKCAEFGALTVVERRGKAP